MAQASGPLGSVVTTSAQPMCLSPCEAHNHERAIIFAVLLVGAAIAKCHTLDGSLGKQEFTVSVLGPESEIKVSAGWHSLWRCYNESENHSLVSDSLQPLDSTGNGILQARMLECVVILFSTEGVGGGEEPIPGLSASGSSLASGSIIPIYTWHPCWMHVHVQISPRFLRTPVILD